MLTTSEPSGSCNLFAGGGTYLQLVKNKRCMERNRTRYACKNEGWANADISHCPRRGRTSPCCPVYGGFSQIVNLIILQTFMNIP